VRAYRIEFAAAYTVHISLMALNSMSALAEILQSPLFHKHVDRDYLRGNWQHAGVLQISRDCFRHKMTDTSPIKVNHSYSQRRIPPPISPLHRRVED
jgi:hypothetical protein